MKRIRWLWLLLFLAACASRPYAASVKLNNLSLCPASALEAALGGVLLPVCQRSVLAGEASPVSTAEAATASPTPPPAVVRAVLFNDPLCTFCKEIVEHQLPLAIQPFGDRLQILSVDVNTDSGRQLYLAALEAYGVPRGVPLIFIGEESVGGINIPIHFPLLVESYLAQGGVDWPAIPGLESYLASQPNAVSPPPLAGTAAAPPPAVLSAEDRWQVRAVMFWQDGCPSCHDVLANVLPPLQQRYGGQLEIILVEIRNLEDVERLYALAALYGFSRPQTGVPFLIIGDRALLGPTPIRTELPALIEHYLAQGGVDLPEIPLLNEMMTASSVTTLAEALESGSIAESTIKPRGFGLAMGVIIGIGLTLAYSLAALLMPRLPVPSGNWLDAATVILIVAGLSVAAYLSYVEIHATSAICGPIGECNLVQSSPYARLFDILPVGVLGVMGYLLLLIALAGRRFLPRLRRLSAWGFFGMAFSGSAFSLYLTWLERFIIRAICIWCIASAVLMTLLLWTSLAPVRQTDLSAHDD
jgi:uncharacterized membrane protein/thiol-disulfide isomerase/thioredoxin/glutaredoxin